MRKGVDPEVVRLLQGHCFHGDVFDVGGGTGDNAIPRAMAGFPVTAADVVEQAVEMGWRNAEERRATESLYGAVVASRLSWLPEANPPRPMGRPS